MPRILVDADACPVKEEVYRVARRLGVPVVVVANSRMQVPLAAAIELKVVASGQLDDVDDWIAERAGPDDIVVSADIRLAARCLAAGAQVLGPDGRAFTEEGIGSALATRELMAGLRELGTISGGPKPFAPQDRSRFLHALDEAVREARRR
ncbi:MAG: YaiI/YqxD family protein [Thermoanaerobaculia bacterium]|nr:YaiI/YqxD family protein [Thermoanaerobaculia bacterium]MBP9825824.1 YaiI/YqxD family protein [Thermoanaerobaculia bacterium]